MDLQHITEFLESKDLELDITELPEAGSGNTWLPTHIVQYINKSDQHTVMLVIGGQHKIVSLGGVIL